MPEHVCDIDRRYGMCRLCGCSPEYLAGRQNRPYGDQWHHPDQNSVFTEPDDE